MNTRDRRPESWVFHENYMRWFSQMDYLEKWRVNEYTTEDIFYGAGTYSKRGEGNNWSIGSVWTCDYRCANCGNRCGGRCGSRSGFILHRQGTGPTKRPLRVRKKGQTGELI